MSEFHQPTVSARLRTPALALVLLGALCALTLAGPAPAHAATADDSVSLEAALDPGTDSVITLTSSITLTARLVIPRDVTIDLAGFDLTGYRMSISTGATFTLDDTDVDADPTTAGRLTATGNGLDTGIQTTGATFVVDAGEVVATGSTYAAGIGGEFGSPGGVVIVNGGSVDATGGYLGSGIGGGYSRGGDTTIHGGTVVAHGGSNGAAIGGAGGNAAGGNFTMDGGTVTAIGGQYGAGIGGGAGGSGGTITITGGVVDSTGGDTGAAALGGGGGSGNGGTVIIGAGATVTARGPGSFTSAGSAVGPGAGSPIFGTLEVTGNLVLPGGSRLRIPDPGTVTVFAGGSITGGGEIEGLGIVVNHGSISLAPTDVTVATVTDHDYTVSFSPAAPLVRVLASTFAAAGQTLPTPTRPGWAFAGWNTDPTGTGTAFDATSTLPGSATAGSVAVTLYARWVSPTLVVSPASTTATAGDVLAFTAEGFGPGGASLGDYTSQVTFGTSHPADDQVTAADIEFRISGTTTVTATLTADPTRTSTASVVVAAGEAVDITVLASDASVDQGDTITLAVTGVDGYGNAVPGMASRVGVVSDHPSDVITGMSVRFPGASTHVLTVTLIANPAVSASATVAVAPAASAFGLIALTGADPSPAIGLGLALLLAGLIATAVAVTRRAWSRSE